MLRPASRTSNDDVTSHAHAAAHVHSAPSHAVTGKTKRLKKTAARNPLNFLYIVLAFGAGMFLQNVFFFVATPQPQMMHPLQQPVFQAVQKPSALPDEFRRILNRATHHAHHCQTLDSTMGVQDSMAQRAQTHPLYNNHTAHLPPFGIIPALQRYEAEFAASKGNDQYPYQCHLPPEYECDETQFTVIFMAYNPDRLDKMYNQILKFVKDKQFAPLVREVLVVWNGDRDVEETNLGKRLVELNHEFPVRISYPLKAGFPNDLLNRYHPRLDVKTKAVMYYDDDGPFYSYWATLAGFELWKRNANAQIGAMARKLDPSRRQRDERKAILNGPGDRFFISHCNRLRTPTEMAAAARQSGNSNKDADISPYVGDELRYNYNEFANFGANMVLPSGSFLHSNYLCYLWHPAFEEIRKYVRAHPVNPDDGTVSIIVSQLSGRSPKVYSRRIAQPQQRRRLSSMGNATEPLDAVGTTQPQSHRRLMEGIDWDKSHPHQAKQKNRWGQMRSDVANSLVRYFGSTNSGSIGWCYGTPQVDASGVYCKPDQAKIGMLPWMKPDHTPLDTCP